MISAAPALPPLEHRFELAKRLRDSDATNILLTKDEAATLAGQSSSKFEKLLHAGNGPRALRFGYRTLRFRASDVMQWLDTFAE